MTIGQKIFYLLITGVVITIVVRLWRRRSKADATKRVKMSDPTYAARVTLEMLEESRGVHPRMRQAMVRTYVHDLVKRGSIPGLTLEHANPDRFEELVTLVRSRAYPETM